MALYPFDQRSSISEAKVALQLCMESVAIECHIILLKKSIFELESEKKVVTLSFLSITPNNLV